MSVQTGEQPNIYNEYDNYAWFWNKYWGRTSARKVLPVIEKVWQPSTNAPLSLLDVCCGTGQLAQLLSKRGMCSSGIDGSPAMIQFAKKNNPDGQFVVGDIRESFGFDVSFDAACSFFDSLNHITSPEELLQVFQHICNALRPGGKFLFDLNMEEGYLHRWNNQAFQIVQDDHVCVDTMVFDSSSQIGTNQVTLFLKTDIWERLDVTIIERCYSAEQITFLLSQAGFGSIEMWEASAEFGFKDEYGRYYIHCIKQ